MMSTGNTKKKKEKRKNMWEMKIDGHAKNCQSIRQGSESSSSFANVSKLKIDKKNGKRREKSGSGRKSNDPNVAGVSKKSLAASTVRH
jgi:hypothetical protein